MNRRHFLASSIAFAAIGLSGTSWARTERSRRPDDQTRAKSLIAAARSQINVTRLYSSAYVRLPYPNGDIALEQGVCSDVVIRAYRQAFGYDLQKTVHEDMVKAFFAYPKIWSMRKPDSNIDHRRVPNLQTFLKRRSAQLEVSDDPGQYKPGDIVTQMISGKLPHIAIVSDRRSHGGERPLILHNIGNGTQEEDGLFKYPITGHYRYFPS